SASASPESVKIRQVPYSIKEQTTGFLCWEERPRPCFHTAIELRNVAPGAAEDMCVPEPKKSSAVMPVAALAMRSKRPTHLEGARHGKLFKLVDHAKPVVEGCNIKGFGPLVHS